MEKLGKLFDSIKNVLSLIDGRIRLWGAILILVFSLIVLLLFNKEIPFNEWYVYLFFLLAILIALASIIDMIGPGRSNNSKEMKAASRSISGIWGEILLNHDFIAFSRISIQYNPTQHQFILIGKSYDKKGEKVAEWNSQATALTSVSPVKLMYFWEGKRLKKYKDVSVPQATGVGLLEFSYEENQEVDSGFGWYISEVTDLIEKNIKGRRYEISIQRLSPKEITEINTPEGRKTFIKNHT